MDLDLEACKTAFKTVLGFEDIDNLIDACHQKGIWGELEEGNTLTHVIGVSLNVLEELLNKTVWRHHEHRKDLEHWFVLKYASFKENATFIGRSLSFGLVLFCLGLCATLVYLLIFALL